MERPGRTLAQHAPVPMDASQTSNAYLALRVALLAEKAHNAAGEPVIARLLRPGLATAIGAMPPRRRMAAARRVVAR